MSTITWHGSREVQLQALISQEWTETGCTTVLQFVGPHADCVAQRPKRGQAIEGWPGVVQRVRVDRAPLTKGTITVTLYDTTIEAVGNETEELAPDEWTLSYRAVVKPLELHPRYNGEGDWGTDTKMSTTLTLDFSGGTAADLVMQDYLKVSSFSTTLGELIQLAKTLPPDFRAALRELGGFVDDLEMQDEFLKKWDAGTEAYEVYFPEIRRVRELAKQPQNLEAPGGMDDSFGYPGTLPKREGGKPYIWRKVVAESSWTGRFGRCRVTEVWQGVDFVDTDIYGGAS